MKSSRKSRRGSLFVESACVLLVFLTILIGTLDVGQLLFLHSSLTERVRAAARYGAVNSYDQTSVENMVLYSQPTIPVTGSPAFELSRSMVSVSRQDAGTSEDRVVVTVSGFPVHFFTPWIAGISQGLSITACASYEGP